MAVTDKELAEVAESYYRPLFRFAFSLARSEADACDLTQQAFYIFAVKSGQIRDRQKVKTWLFTTLYREFLKTRRRREQFAEEDLESVENLPPVDAESISMLDGQTVLEKLQQVQEVFRAPLTLFYLEQHSYLEIAEILDVPVGTVMSRISRGKQVLRSLLAPGDRPKSSVIPLDTMP